MSDVFLLTARQMARIVPFFPLAHGVPRVDDRRVVSGIVYVIKNGLQWKDAPKAYGPHKTLYNRFIRWSRLGVFDRIFASLAGEGAKARADHDRRHPSQSASHGGEPSQKGDVPRRLGRTKGGLNSKLHAVCDDQGRPLVLLLSEGQMSDHKGARLMLGALPPAKILIADRGYDSAAVPPGPRRQRHRPLHPLDHGAGRSRSPTTRPSIASATRSRTCSPSSRIGAASPPATTAAPTPSSRPSVSLPPSPSISINES